MDTRVIKFIFKKANGLLDAWKGRLLPKTSGDVECGLLNLTRSPSTNSKSQRKPDCRRSRSASESSRNKKAHPQDIMPTSVRAVELMKNHQSQFTEGPARLVVVNDGSKDCLALLLTETFVAKTRDLYEDSHHLSGKQGPLQQLRWDVQKAEASLRQVKESLERAESEEQADKLQELAEKRESELIESRHRKDDVEEGAELLQSRISASRIYTKWVLETAMGEANLLEAHRPLTPFIVADTEDDEDASEIYNRRNSVSNDDETQDAVQTSGVPSQQPVRSVTDTEAPTNSEDGLADEDSIRQAAWEDYNDKLTTFYQVQAIFDDRHQAYETQLAKFKNGVKMGIYNMSRSEFDRHRVQYGQKLTRALIEAEEAFDAAKAYAKALGATGSDYEQTNVYGGYAESTPESEMASYNASRDHSNIYSWMIDIPESDHSNGFEPVELDDWDAKEVDQTDSISQIDFEEYRKPIDQWQYECSLARGDGPEDYYLGPVNIEFLDRRHSFSLSRSDVGEWDVST